MVGTADQRSPRAGRNAEPTSFTIGEARASRTPSLISQAVSLALDQPIRCRSPAATSSARRRWSDFAPVRHRQTHSYSRPRQLFAFRHLFERRLYCSTPRHHCFSTVIPSSAVRFTSGQFRPSTHVPAARPFVAIFAMRFASVQRRLAWNRRQCDRPNFVERMIAEIRSSGVLVLRMHVAGDFYDAEYVRKWSAIVKRSPRVRFYGYTRSWRVPAIAHALEQLTALSAMRLWYSIDDETGVPSYVPPSVRLAYLQKSPAAPPSVADLVFRPHSLRTLPESPIVCDHETISGKRLGVTCGSCGRCFH
jgi:hypothetical protein